MDQQVHSERNVLHDILHLVKQNIILILVVIIATVSVGIVFSSFRKPKYITEEQVLFSMGDGTSITSDVNTMYAYKGTVMDFADNGVVVDRANYYASLYYKKYSASVTTGNKLQSFINDVLYLEKRVLSCKDEIAVLDELAVIKTEIDKIANNGISASEKTLYDKLNEEAELLRQQAGFISKIREYREQLKTQTSDAEIKRLNASIKDAETRLIEAKRGTVSVVDYSVNTIQDIENKKIALNDIILAEKSSDLYYEFNREERVTGYLTSSRISVTDYVYDTESKSFAFGVKYTDHNEQLSKENVKLLVLAFNVASSYFFEGLYPVIEDLGMAGCSVDVTQSMIIIVSVLLGVVLSCLIIYLKKVFDKTVKDKEVVEMITGVKVMACIERQEDVTNG